MFFSFVKKTLSRGHDPDDYGKSRTPSLSLSFLAFFLLSLK